MGQLLVQLLREVQLQEKLLHRKLVVMQGKHQAAGRGGYSSCCPHTINGAA